MKSKKSLLQSGQVAKLLLVLVVIVFVAIIITSLIVNMSKKPPKPANTEVPTVPLPVYEKQLGNIRFVFQSARDLGNTLVAANAINSAYASQKDLTTTERFIEIVVGAQNKGTLNTELGAWDLGNIVDKDGNNFVPMDGYIVAPWLPPKNLCGALLKPSFDPTPCIKIYEVAKSATGLKLQVLTGQNNNSANDLSAGRKLSFDLDLIVK